MIIINLLFEIIIDILFISFKTISVNFPLRYNELTVYQTDWNVIGLRLKIDDKLYQLPLTAFDKGKNLWGTWIPSLTENKNDGLIFICSNIFLYLISYVF